MMKRGMIVGVLIGVLVFTATSLAEDITLTTYYPAPYGEYEELYVSGEVGIGTTNPRGALEVQTIIPPAGWNYARIYLNSLDSLGRDESSWMFQSFYTGVGDANPLLLSDAGQGSFFNPDIGEAMFKFYYDSGSHFKIYGADFEGSQQGGSAYLWLNADGGIDKNDKWYLAAVDNYDNPGYFYLSNNDKGVIFKSLASNGYVGIGNTTGDPGYILDVYHATSKVNSQNGYLTAGADYAEYFENEEVIPQGSLVGINMVTGKVRRYCPGDEFLGIVSNGRGFIGNGDKTIENDQNYTMVGLLGQLEFNQDEVVIENRIVYTKDKKKVGILLSSGKVVMRQGD